MLHLTMLQFRELAQRNDLFGHIYFTLMQSLFLILFNENIKKSITCFHSTNLSIEKSSQYDNWCGLVKTLTENMLLKSPDLFLCALTFKLAD